MSITAMDHFKTQEPCQVHHAHRPRSHLNHHHHVWPLSLGGPDIWANKIVVCPTGHYNIHTLLDLYVRNHGEVPWELARPYSHQERYFARLGYSRHSRGSM